MSSPLFLLARGWLHDHTGIRPHRDESRIQQLSAFTQLSKHNKHKHVATVSLESNVMQEGMRGLQRALEKFEPEKGFPLLHVRGVVDPAEGVARDQRAQVCHPDSLPHCGLHAQVRAAVRHRLSVPKAVPSGRERPAV